MKVKNVNIRDIILTKDNNWNIKGQIYEKLGFCKYCGELFYGIYMDSRFCDEYCESNYESSGKKNYKTNKLWHESSYKPSHKPSHKPSLWRHKANKLWREKRYKKEREIIFYCDEWVDKKFKQMLIDRDKNKCQNLDCWRTNKYLVLHHVDYNKSNCHPDNLITLCNSCNSRANGNRDYHSKFYHNLLKEQNKLFKRSK